MSQEKLFGDDEKAADATEHVPFEDVMGELEGIVRKLEAGDLSLEDSLDAFERGMKLSKDAEARLEQAEQRIERLVAGGNTVPFDA